MDGYVPDFDATVVTRVLEAGGTIVGKNVTLSVMYLDGSWRHFNGFVRQLLR